MLSLWRPLRTIVLLFPRSVLGSEYAEQPRSTEAVAGEDVTLSCAPPRGQPSPRVRWSKDNHPLKPDSSRVAVLPSGSLRIRKVRRQDAGSYVCTAYNIGGEKDSNAATLTVKGIYYVGSYETSRFDSNSNRTSRFEFESKVMCRFEFFSKISNRPDVCRHTTNYAHSLFNRNINLCAVCS